MRQLAGAWEATSLAELTAAVLAVGLVVGGYTLGNGLVRARDADRSVTVRGLAERDVTADLATWSLTYSAKAGDLAGAQALLRVEIEADRQSRRHATLPQIQAEWEYCM